MPSGEWTDGAFPFLAPTAGRSGGRASLTYARPRRLRPAARHAPRRPGPADHRARAEGVPASAPTRAAPHWLCCPRSQAGESHAKGFYTSGPTCRMGSPYSARQKTCGRSSADHHRATGERSNELERHRSRPQRARHSHASWHWTVAGRDGGPTAGTVAGLTIRGDVKASWRRSVRRSIASEPKNAGGPRKPPSASETRRRGSRSPNIGRGLPNWSKGASRPPRRSLACAAALAKRSIGHARTEAAPAAVLQRQAEPIGAGARCHHRRRNHPRPRTAPAPAV
jgi:hypothetical protein